MFLRILLNLLCGALAAACMPQAGIGPLTWNFAPYSFVLLVPAFSFLYFSLRDRAAHGVEAFFYAYAWALGYLVLHLNWIGNALLVDGNPYAWAYPLAILGLPALLALYWGIAGTIALPLLHRASSNLDPLVFAAVFTAAEWARGQALTGFPWGLPGMFWVNVPSIFQSLSLIGLDGLTFLTLWWALMPYIIISNLRESRQVVTIAAFTLLGVFAYGTDRLDRAPINQQDAPQIVLVQANIPQAEKWSSEHLAAHFDAHLKLSLRPDQLADRPTLIIWPETALPPAFINNPNARANIKALLSTYPAHSFLLTGALQVKRDTTTGEPAYYNSALVYDRDGTPHSVYDKHHLVPFGEYIPFQRYIPLAPVTQFVGQRAGTGPTSIQLPHLPPFSPLICYEIIFPNIAQPQNSPTPARWLINLTNDAWYGDTAGPRQHLDLARARAVENGLPVVRVAGTGISGVIDATGTIQHILPYNHAGRLTATLPPAFRRPTFYHLYGDIPLLVLIGGVILLSLRRRR